MLKHFTEKNLRRRVKAIALIFIYTLIAFKYGHCSGALTYAGRSLDLWMNDLSSDKSARVRDQARKAVHEIGTNAIPALISKLKDCHHANRREQYFTVREAFTALGPAAAPAIPSLVKLMNDGGEQSCVAAHILAHIGKEGVLPLVERLTNGTLDIRICITTFITESGTNAQIAIPALLGCMENRSIETNKSAALRSFAACALGVIGVESEKVVPALAQRLQDENPAVRFNAARALRNFGKRAESAETLLNRAAQDPDYHVRIEASKALQQLQY